MRGRYTPLVGSNSGASKTLEDLARRHGLALILQFGSTVDGAVHESSDLDIAVLFDERPPGLDERSEIVHELQGLFPKREIDLAVINHADPLFLKQVLERCRLLTGSARRLAELKIYGFKRYQDHRRYLALESEHVRRVLSGA
jgi:predicted nucleotidyltransferase